MYFLDTNICAYFISRRYPAVTARFRAVEPHELAISALALDAVLVTHNTREFERIDGLKLENWAA
ncbi:hypothetical protein Tther_01317 [Tepidimonas thermarum]|uniref:tRNA(fMet)-specific endonuclease VapC n=1 Tax=Tepidimonas thermarum TaxID=335431 RepID=A0A554X1X5_9BURK|nr:type II toxin-antitoxin system VapC family toxin [Tepidimonas thermarum]TSE29795.1 hypothetical protein Tther_01317 [Tepidimonas thermarum]